MISRVPISGDDRGELPTDGMFGWAWKLATARPPASLNTLNAHSLGGRPLELHWGTWYLRLTVNSFDQTEIHDEECAGNHEGAAESQGIVNGTTIWALKAKGHEQRAKAGTDGK